MVARSGTCQMLAIQVDRTRQLERPLKAEHAVSSRDVPESRLAG
jgi:hypothetical protein